MAQWGPTAIQDTGDDCSDHNSTPDTTGLRVGVGGYCVGYRWVVNIPAGATIDHVYVKTYAVNYGSGGTINSTWCAYDASDPGQWGDSQRPSTVTSTTATVTDNFTGNFLFSWKTSPDLKTIVQELLDSYSLVNKAICICWRDNSSAANQWQAWEDLSAAGGHAATLQIDYTASGLSIPVVQGIYRRRR